jgi:hypothetical protein
LSDVVDVLAHHAVRGKLGAKAVHYPAGRRKGSSAVGQSRGRRVVRGGTRPPC